MSKGESVIQLSPTSLRFWEKLGLSPRSGPKDVVAFVFFEEKKDEDRETEIESWLTKVSAAYSVLWLTFDIIPRHFADCLYRQKILVLMSLVVRTLSQSRDLRPHDSTRFARPFAALSKRSPPHIQTSSSTSLLHHASSPLRPRRSVKYCPPYGASTSSISRATSSSTSSQSHSFSALIFTLLRASVAWTRLYAVSMIVSYFQ